MARVGHISIGGLSSGMDTDSMVKELMAVQRMKVDRLKKKNTSITYRQEEWKKMNDKIYSFYSKEASVFKLKSNFLRSKISNSDDKVAKILDVDKAPTGIHEVEVLELAKNASVESKKIVRENNRIVNDKVTMRDLQLENKAMRIHYKTPSGAQESVTVIAGGDDTLEQFAKKIEKATQGRFPLDVNVDFTNKKMFIRAKESGEKEFFLNGEIAERFGLDQGWNKGSNAKFRYNDGEILESKTNELRVNGLKVIAKSKGKTTVDVERDTEAAYKQVVHFVKKYNELVKEMQDKLSVSISRNQRDMEPLTDEEKKALSEDEVKKWEETLRGRVFVRDRNIKNILDDMRSSFAFSELRENDEYKTLGSIGLGTGSFRDHTGAMLFIDGDSEVGGSRAGSPNRLREALEKNPEEVANLLSNLGEKLYNKIANRMKSTTQRSFMSFYDDKALKEEQKRFDKRIEEMEEKMIVLEDRYRKQFAEMEKALARSNSMASSMMQQLGGLR